MITSSSLNVTQTGYPAGMVMANTVSGGALMFLIIIIIGVTALMLLITSLERHTLFFETFEKFLNTIKYTVTGAGLIAALLALYFVCQILAEFGSGVNPIHIGLGIAAYALVTLFGWLVWKLVQRFSELHKQYRKEHPHLKDENV